jgi:hypothetical protein
MATTSAAAKAATARAITRPLTKAIQPIATLRLIYSLGLEDKK